MTRIFISYRHIDSNYVCGEVYQKLAKEYGRTNVFKDLSSLPPGVTFREVIRDFITSSQFVLAIIGQRWSGEDIHTKQRRIDDQDDFVRTEIEIAIQENIPVIPIFIEEMSFDKLVIPESIQSIRGFQSRQLRPFPDFDRDFQDIILSISTRSILSETYQTKSMLDLKREEAYLEKILRDLPTNSDYWWDIAKNMFGGIIVSAIILWLIANGISALIYGSKSDTTFYTLAFVLSALLIMVGILSFIGSSILERNNDIKQYEEFGDKVSVIRNNVSKNSAIVSQKIREEKQRQVAR